MKTNYFPIQKVFTRVQQGFQGFEVQIGYKITALTVFFEANRDSGLTSSEKCYVSFVNLFYPRLRQIWPFFHLITAGYFIQ